MVKRIARGLVLAVLLLAPSIALEFWLRHETGLLPYLEDGYRYQLESKLIMFDHVDCPSSIAMGTSMTEVSLNAATFDPYAKATGDKQFDPIFTFAAPGTRPIAMLAIWRRIRDTGCTPKFLFVEVSPVILNAERGEEFERMYMSFDIQKDVLPERFDRSPYTFRYRVDLATWWRSFTYRNREPILKYLSALFGFSKPLPPIDPIPPDGKVHVTATRGLEGSALNGVYQSTKKIFDKKEFKYSFTPSYPHALLLLAEEAKAAGTTIVFHTAPVPAMFHEFMDSIGATKPFCDFYDDVHARGIRWYSEHRAVRPASEFSDWLHVNVRGAIGYTGRMLAAVASGQLPHDQRCRG